MNDENANKDRKEDKTDGKKGRPNLLLIGVVVGLLFVAVWASRDKSAKVRSAASSGDDEGAETGAAAVETPSLGGLGRVLGIGPRALAFKADGTTVVDASTLSGLAELLDGADVDAVVNALEQAGIENVLVDPAVTPRNPLPKATVKNRLALARPAGRLSAKLMTREYFYYQIGEPPLDIPEQGKTMLMSLARSTFGGGSGDLPADAPPILKKPGSWTVILTVRPVQNRHLSYHSVTSENLADAARQAGRKARKYYESRKQFEEAFGPLAEALPKRLGLELEVLYDEGTFVGPRDADLLWRIIEPGINGIRMNISGKIHYLPPWYSVANNYRLVDDLFERIVRNMGGMDKNYWKRPEVSFDRFRTVHWRETRPGGPIQDLYRFSPRVPAMQDVTRENMVKALVGLNNWIGDNAKPDGRYMYRYFPTSDEENEEYNLVRHCLGPFSMALTQEFAPNPTYQQKADLGMSYIEKSIRWGGPPRQDDGTIDTAATTWMGKPLPGPDVAIVEFPEPPKNEWSSKMGAVAVSILGYTQYKRVGWAWTPEKQRILDGLARFLLYMRNEKDGSFYHYYVAEKNQYYGQHNSIYPGEILYAVARLYGETKDDRYRQAFKESMKTDLEWFKGQLAQKLPDGTYEEEQRKNLVQFQPWIAMAMDEMYRYDPDPAYVEASNFVSFWIIDQFQFDEERSFFPDYLGGYFKVLDELPAMHTFVYTEGVAASFDLARRSGADQATIEKLRKGALLAARFLIQQQARPGENDFFYPNPKKAAGGVRYCMNHNKQRIDYTYHALSSAYRIIRAATDEDYAWAQTVPMPKSW